jgi:hypothetical protein
MPKKNLVKAVLRYKRLDEFTRTVIEGLLSGKQHPIFDNILYQKFKELIDSAQPIPPIIASVVERLIEEPPTPESIAQSVVAWEVYWLSLIKRKDGTFNPIPEVFEDVAEDIGISSSTVKDCYYKTFAGSGSREELKVLRLPDDDQFLIEWNRLYPGEVEESVLEKIASRRADADTPVRR